MKKWWLTALSVFLALLFTFAGSVFAFSDITGDPAESAILSLKQSGIINGFDEETFAPKGKLSYASAVQLIVKGFNLNIDSIRFIKEPKASDYFVRIPNHAWYASAFIAAHLNGLPIPKDVDPEQMMTREQFADLLFKAMVKQGDFAFIEIWVQIKDEPEINADYMNSIQKLVISKVVELQDGYMHPKREITRSEAAKMLHAALRFVKDRQIQVPPAHNDQDVSFRVERVNEEINKIIVSWGEKPNAGYQIAIKKIEFADNGEAVIYYQLHEPKRGQMAAQVITEPKAYAFVSAQYKPIIRNIEREAALNGSIGFETRY